MTGKANTNSEIPFDLSAGIVLREYKDTPLTFDEMDRNLKAMTFFTAERAFGFFEEDKHIFETVRLIQKAPTHKEVIEALKDKSNLTIDDLKEAIPTYINPHDNYYMFIMNVDQYLSEEVFNIISEGDGVNLLYLAIYCNDFSVAKKWSKITGVPMVAVLKVESVSESGDI